jgi:hypothetical protein
MQDVGGINLFLDNDTAGRTANQKIIRSYDKVTDWSKIIYPDHKDFNAFLMYKKSNQ